MRIAAPIAIVWDARTTFLKSSAYLVVLGLPAHLLNRLHLECVSESGCSCNANYIAKMIGLTPLTDNKYTFNLFYVDIRDITSALWTLEILRTKNSRYQYKATLLTLLETSADSLSRKEKKSRYNVTVPAQKVMSFSIELMLQHRFETVLVATSLTNCYTYPLLKMILLQE